MRTLAAALILAATAGNAAAIDLFRYRSRPKLLPGIPAYEYQWFNISGKIEAQSTQGVLLPRLPLDGAAAKAGRRVRYFQLDRASLNVEHCSISRVAFTMEEGTGSWKLTLQANQNAAPTPLDTVLPGAGKRKGDVFTEHLKRNQFFVRVRGLGAASAAPPADPRTAPAPPVLFQLIMPGFWVERGEPYPFEALGATPWVSKYFDAVERIEIEFYYR